MGNISKVIGVMKFTLLFIAMAISLQIFLLVDHEEIHMSVFDYFNATEGAYIKYDLSGGYTFYNHSLCLLHNGCYEAQEAIESTKEESDDRFMHFVSTGFLFCLLFDIASYLIKQRRLKECGLSYEKDELNSHYFNR